MLKIAAIVFPLLLLCRVTQCDEIAGKKGPETTGTPDALGSRTASELQVGDGESRGVKDVGVLAEDTEARQNPGSFPPRITSGRPPPAGQFPSPGGQFPPPAGQFPPPAGQFPPPAGQFPPPGSFGPDPFQDFLPQGGFPGQFPSRPFPGPPRPGPFPGQFPPRPLPGPAPSGAFPAQYPTRPFPGQRPPRPPPPPGAPYPGPYFDPPFSPLPLPMTLVNSAVSSISEFDEHKCVPRLLCEISSGSMPGIYSGGYNPPYYRPYRPQSESGFAGQEQLLQLLAALTLRNREASPLAFFGGAALLGISSRGRPEHCYKAFPTCPQDSDGLLDYLNNHRGGFFKALQPLRAFAGQEGPVGPRPPPRPFPHRPLGPQQPFGQQQPLGQQQTLSPRPLTYYSNGYQSDFIDSANAEGQSLDADSTTSATGNSEPRIQTQPEHILGAIQVRPVRPVDWRFPNDFTRLGPDGKITIFPQNQNVLTSDKYRKGYRRGKKQDTNPTNPSTAPVNNYPYVVPTIFPDRTGTGDLRLDNSELFGNGAKPNSDSGTRYGRVYFPKDVVENVNRPGEINTRYIVIFPGPAS